MSERTYTDDELHEVIRNAYDAAIEDVFQDEHWEHLDENATDADLARLLELDYRATVTLKIAFQV